MPLTPGHRLGPYEIVGPIGQGGMGEVYRGRDTRLDRDVAIKVLPPLLAGDPQFLSRFQREAKSISALNHPHICGLYDVGEAAIGAETLHYLVLEMIEGESLEQRLARGPLALDEVLRWGAEVASALDAAHSRGIVHRDLKPGNVMVTRAGTKLVDFGLAKGGDRGVVSGVTQLQTMETPTQPLTEHGTILGTFQYMSPEQLEGTPADSRSDIFALGALLYEMATGRKAFEGKNRTSLIAAIVATQPPPITSVQAASPPALDHVVRRCLEKDPDDRWQSARDVRAQLLWIAEGGSQVGVPAVVSSRRRSREKLAWAAAAALGLAAAGFAAAWVRRAPEPGQVVRFTITTPAGLTAAGPPAVSPDGRIVAFDGVDASGKRQIWIRTIDGLEARPLNGTEGVNRPFWSPDSQYLAFIAGGKLKKIPAVGGPVQTISDAPTGADGTWSRDGVILFDGDANDPILRVDAAGGVAKPEVLNDPKKNAAFVGWPQFLPDGRHYLYLSGILSSERTLMVRALGETEGKPLFKTTSRVAYSPLGYLLYVRDQTLVAQRFDAASLAVTGDPVPVGEGLGVSNVGTASFSLSDTGVLAYRAGEEVGRRLVWMDRAGKESPAVDGMRRFADAWLSPDGNRVVYDVEEGAAGGDLWIRDLVRGVTSRFTFDEVREFAPIWSPDGQAIAFTKETAAGWDLYVKDAAGTGEAKPLITSPVQKFPTDWSGDGRHLIFNSSATDTGWDLYALPMTGGGATPIPLVRTRFSDMGGSLSPDGRFLAYQSNESGRNQIYVQEFPTARSKWQVSSEGGLDPFWRRDGRELYFRALDQSVMAVPVEATGSTFQTGTPQALFRARFASVITRARFRPAADGQRFLVLTRADDVAVSPAIVVLNWTEGLR